MELIWQGKDIIPRDWTIGLINPIPKKGDMTKCNNYRAITLLNTAYKVTMSIIRKKLEDIYQAPHIYEELLGKYQCGFRKEKATTNQLFNLKLLVEKLWEYNIPSYLFIDFKMTYDCIVREELWKTKGVGNTRRIDAST